MKSQKYKTIELKGTYTQRQRAANRHGCDGYLELHYNSHYRETARYGMVIVGENASQKSIEWGKNYCSLLHDRLHVPLYDDTGINVGGFNGRGNGNIAKTNMPAILIEPLFCSNPQQSEIIKSADGQRTLARCIVDSIKIEWPSGAYIAFSTGHLYKSKRSLDRGAKCHGGGYEGDYSRDVLRRVLLMLESEV